MNFTAMGRLLLIGFVSTLLLMTAGCGDTREDEVDQILSDIEIPTQEEADARAAQQITPENADEEFERLQRELLEDDDF